jgi:hypothetical protein
MSANKGGQFSAKEDHAIAAEVNAYTADVTVALSDEYGRMGDGAGGGGSESLTGAVVDVLGANVVLIRCKVTAAAAHAGNTVFEFVSSVDGTIWDGVLDENNFTTVTVAGPATAAGTCYKSAIVDVRGLHKIKLSNIDNSAVAVAITANCSISKVN